MTEYLKKGHEVRYITSRISMSFISQLMKDGLWDDCTVLPDGRVEIKGFVAGDTDVDGISLVAFSNPEICLLSLTANDPVIKNSRLLAASGVFDVDKDLDYNGLISQDGYYQPVCQFK